MSQCLNPDCLAINLETYRFCQKCGQKLWLKDRYQALKLIGQGGFGKTFLAIDHDKPSKPYCVIKQFFPKLDDPNDREKATELFGQEAIRLDELGKHPQIPALLAYFVQENQDQYLIQEYIEGQNLQQELKNKGIFNQAEILKLLTDLLPILDFIHQCQVIHRDIKPENIIRREQYDKLVLVDFGAAKAVTPLNRSVTGTVIGSAEYMAPEQLNGKAINASDLYSLGVTCLYLLTGVSPLELFDSGEHEWVWQDHLNNNAVSDDLGKVIDKMINFGTKKRYQNAVEILQDLGIDLAALSEKSAQNTAQPIIYIVPSPDLKSSKNVDYTELRNLLKEGNWKGADRETARLMCEVAGRVDEGYLTEENIDGFPKEDIKTIDKLWKYYSNGKFGFSVQAEIYRSFNGQRRRNDEIWKNFCHQLGWCTLNEEKYASWISYSNIEFSVDAPVGHLPTPLVIHNLTWKVMIARDYPFSEQVKCGIFFARAGFVFFFSLANNQE
jgi:serine/threonine protein kinase